MQTHTHTSLKCHWKSTCQAELLTHSELLAEDGPLTEGRAVPSAIAELVLTLIDTHLSTLTDNNDGVRAALTDGALSGGQSGDFVADNIGTQSHHWG